MSHDFHVGQKVVCLRKKWSVEAHPNLEGVTFPVFNRVYTIRNMDYLRTSYGEGVVLWFREIRNPVVKFRDLTPMEAGFAARDFRPLRERKTDISIFTSMLTTTKLTEDA